MEQTELIETMHPSRRRGMMMPRVVYDSIVVFIAEMLDGTDNVTLAMLLEAAGPRFRDRGDVSYLVYQVKLDLEMRGYLRQVATENHLNIQRLRFTAQGIKELRKRLSQEKVTRI